MDRAVYFRSRVGMATLFFSMAARVVVEMEEARAGTEEKEVEKLAVRREVMADFGVVKADWVAAVVWVGKLGVTEELGVTEAERCQRRRSDTCRIC